MKKVLRETQTLRALAVVRCGHRPPVVRPPQIGPITIHCAAMLSAQCNELRITKVAHVIILRNLSLMTISSPKVQGSKLHGSKLSECLFMPIASHYVFDIHADVCTVLLPSI